METREVIAKALREARLKAGLTQLAAAKALGYGTGMAVGQWEHGKAHPPANKLETLQWLYKGHLNLSRLQDLYFKHGQEVLRQRIYGKRK